ncbi:hypothetical protein N9903_01345 [bacterium]|nr:hypothetical protein [bacterium]
MGQSWDKGGTDDGKREKSVGQGEFSEEVIRCPHTDCKGCGYEAEKPRNCSFTIRYGTTWFSFTT